MKLMRTRTMLATGAALLVALPAALAQMEAPPVPTGPIHYKNRAPLAKETLRVHFPRPKEYTLPNGMLLMVLENHKLPTVAMSMDVLAGSFFEPANRQGLAAMTASMLDEGTKHRTAEQITQQVARLGASLGADADQGGEWASVSISGLSTTTDTLLDIFRDVIRNPTFPADQFAKVKTRTIAGLTEAIQDPDTLAEVAAARAVYGNTPPARILAPISQVRALTRGDLARFHATYYRPDRAILGVVGDVNAEAIHQKILKAFGDWKRGTQPLRAKLPAFAPKGKTRVFVVDRPGSVQTSMRLANLALTRKNPDYFALTVMNRILGGDPIASRLGKSIREEKGYTYDVYSTFSAPRYPGLWEAATEVRNAVTQDTLAEFKKQFQGIETQPVSTTELASAKRSLVGRFALGMESPATILSMMMALKEYGLPANYWDTYPQKIQAVSAADVERVAKKYIGQGRAQIVLVGAKSAVQTAGAPYGPVTVLDLAKSLQ